MFVIWCCRWESLGCFSVEFESLLIEQYINMCIIYRPAFSIHLALRADLSMGRADGRQVGCDLCL
jgi:hypothetical protein